MNKKIFLTLICVLCAAVILACSGNKSDAPASGFGSLSVQILWPENQTTRQSSGPHKAAPVGVVTMRFIVSGSSMTTMQQDFAASAGSGVIPGVPAGTDRTLTILGINASSVVTYQTYAPNLTVIVGQTTPCGTVTMSAVLPMKVPDTGQITKYSLAFGDDSDYLINAPSFTDNGNGTIIDNVTGLMWQKQDDATARIWDAAGIYCNGLTLGGHSDWRLPSRMELLTIVDYGRFNPSINTTYFPSTQYSNYWTSVTGVFNTDYVWGVHFGNGYANVSYMGNANYVRCVR